MTKRNEILIEAFNVGIRIGLSIYSNDDIIRMIQAKKAAKAKRS